MKIVIAADLHVGANKFGTSNEKWAAPLVELVDYAIEHAVDAVAVAGDMFHHRRPTTWASQFVSDQLFRLTANDINVIGVDGNHDDGVALDTVSASWFIGDNRWARKKVSSVHIDGVQIVLMPWVTPQAYQVQSDLPLSQQLDEAQFAAMIALGTHKMPDVVNILIGHAMVAYGPGADDLAPSPGLQWAGKDVVFDYNTLAKGFDAVYLGHVHDPRMKGFVGSSQPTDWGDAGQEKSFIEVDISKAPVITESYIPYKTSLALLDVTREGPFTPPFDDIDIAPMGENKWDVGRYRYHVKAGDWEPDTEAIATIRSQMERLCDRVESIEVTK
ncbi:hypothetical protein LCGC14_3065230, partial [marine sediment metagenome]